MGKAAKEPRLKVYEIQTHVYDVYGKPYVNVIKLKPWLDGLRAQGVVREYAYIVHDRDKYTQADEDKAAAEIAQGIQRKAIKAGDSKPEHLHLVLQLTNAMTPSAFCKRYPEIQPNWLVYVRENVDGEAATFDDKAAYLCHERQPDKAPYGYDEIVCSFDYGALMKRYAKRMQRKNRGLALKAFRDEHVNKIAAGEETVAEFITANGYAVYEADKAKYDHAEQYYLSTAYRGAGFRLTYLVTGPSTTGKTPLAKLLACSLFPDIKNPRDVYFCVGDKGVMFDSYRGQPVIIWDDWRAVSFVSTFSRDVVFGSLFAVHPEPTQFNIKYGAATLRHTVNIVTTVESVDAFARSLAGEYTDRNGVQHTSEEQQILQAYKRIWGLSEVTEQEIALLFNSGYYRGNVALEFYRQYEMAARLKNQTAQLVAKYDPVLYGVIGGKMLPQVKDRYDDFAARQAAKITDEGQIDDADIPQPLPLPSPVRQMAAGQGQPEGLGVEILPPGQNTTPDP